MPPATKRMSADEKKTMLLNLYHATKDVYTEKEVQSIGSKAGISSGAGEERRREGGAKRSG